MPQRLVHIASGDEDLVDGAAGPQRLNHGVTALNLFVLKLLVEIFPFFFQFCKPLHNYLVYILPYSAFFFFFRFANLQNFIDIFFSKGYIVSNPMSGQENCHV